MLTLLLYAGGSDAESSEPVDADEDQVVIIKKKKRVVKIPNRTKVVVILK